MKKTICAVLIALIVLTFSNLPSYAIGFTVNIVPDKTTITEGETVNVTISTNNLNIGGQGMNVFSCVLDYDKNIFEEISSNDITGLNNWLVSYNKVTGKILLDNENFVTQDSDLCTISFQVKEGAQLQDTQIAVSNPQTSNNQIDISGTDGVVTIYVKQLSSDIYTITNDNKIKNIAPETPVDTFKSNLTGATGVTILNKNGSVVTSGNIGTGFILQMPSGDRYTLIVTGDIDGNGKISSTDASQLKRHIIEEQLITEPFLTAADVDGNGRISSTDLSKLVKIIVGIE